MQANFVNLFFNVFNINIQHIRIYSTFEKQRPQKGLYSRKTWRLINQTNYLAPPSSKIGDGIGQ